jgi:carboxyl-terminal processing protease
MEISRQQSPAGWGERAARSAVVVFLVLAIVTLAFGLGYVVKDLRGGDNKTATPSVRTSQATPSGADSVGASILDEIYSVLKSQYVDRDALDAETLRHAAIAGVIGSLNDRETSYLTPEEVKAGALDLGSSYQGIGASVSQRNGQVEIVAPFRDSPAEKAGVRAGDAIMEVDGERTDGWTDQLAVQKIRGPRGTTVTIKVKHIDGTFATLSIVRGDIQIESVFTELNLQAIPGESGKTLVDRTGKAVPDIAYVNIAQFHDNTVNELRTKARDIESKGYKGLILDLRSNPGGLLSATIDVADEFLTNGTILSEIDGDGKRQSWTAKPGGILTKIPIVILMDKGSASGAEVLAAALRDNGRATILGTVSFGKGTVNQLQPLKNCGDPKGCGALYLAVGRWLTPKGEQIEGTGVKPDIELTMTGDDYIDQGDIQLFKAIEILRGK